MIIEYIAIWTSDLERLRSFYCKYFNGVSNEKYVNPKKGFESYFLHFNSGARLELMQMRNIPANTNDTVSAQHQGIIHIAFGVESPAQVDLKAAQLKEDGYQILSGPRITGDGYYEFETLDPDNNRLEVTSIFSE